MCALQALLLYKNGSQEFKNAHPKTRMSFREIKNPRHSRDEAFLPAVLGDVKQP
jgi:hypothetical protein